MRTYGDNVFVKEAENGKKSVKKVSGYSPRIFVKTPALNSEWKTIHGESVVETYAGSLKETHMHLRLHSSDAFGPPRFEYQYIVDNYGDDFNLKDHSIWCMDIESEVEQGGFPDLETANEKITLITMQDLNTKNIFTFGIKPYTGEKDINYIYCEDESTLLRKFLEFWKVAKVDIITGWNLEFFDMPYMVHRISKILGKKDAMKLSPFGIIKRNNVKFDKHAQSEFSYDIFGVSQLDYMKMYKNFVQGKKESYRLDFIADLELGCGKVKNPYSNFKDFYTKAWNTFVEYNIRDVTLISEMDEKKKFISIIIGLAHRAGINYEDVFFQTRIWDGIIYKFLLNRNTVIPPKVPSEKTEQYEGAYVKDTLVGLYKYIASFDLTSVYPNSIIQYNISSETTTNTKFKCSIDDLVSRKFDTSPAHKMNYAITGNGCCYKKDKDGFLPIIINEIFDERTKHKKRMIEAQKEYENDKSRTDLLNIISQESVLQQALKICLVSAYGAFGNEYFRYYNVDIAESITLSSQLTVLWVAKRVNQKMNEIMSTENEDYIIAMDTDSLYLNMEPLVNKVASDKTVDEKINFMDKSASKFFQPFIESTLNELAEYMNAKEQRMVMKRESLADSGLFMAKKKYMLRVYDAEGVRFKEPKILIKGAESIKSDTPGIVRKMMLDLYPVILSGEEDKFHDMVSNFKDEFINANHSDIAVSTGLSDINKYHDSTHIFKKGTPGHVKGALVFNHFLRKKNLESKYKCITNSDKIKYIYLVMPNPLLSNIVSFYDELPEEFNLENYIDYSKQFEKVFENPMQRITDILGWSLYEENTLF